MTIPDWPYEVIQWSVFALFAFMCVSAWRNGKASFVTLLYGSLFGLIVEVLIVGGENPSYTYETATFYCFHEAPLWVGLGWGIVSYACVRTSQKLALKASWWSDLLWRPLTAGYLAVSIDVTLDPVANALKFWEWHSDCLLTHKDWQCCPSMCPPDPRGVVQVLRFYGVPFDNFVGGWFAIPAMFALSVGLLSGAQRLVTRGKHPEARPLHHLLRHDSPTPTGHGKVWEWVFILVGQALAMVVAGALFWFFIRPAAGNYYRRYPTDGELRLCLSVFVIAGLVTAYVAAFTERTGKIDWGVFFVPLFFNGLPILLLALVAFRKEPALYLDVPANLALGLLLFTWPFQENLIDVGRCLMRRLRRSVGIGSAEGTSVQN